ncbi:MAG: TrkA family potassium uptake protein [Blastochloris sp.]|nr:TrkA family potassium uptake protein [Blastochloris sp.]
MSKKYAVIGLGSFGSSAARALAHMGVEVIAIDRNRERVEAIKDAVSTAVIVDASDEKAIQAQELQDCAGVILALGDKLGENVLVLSTLQSLGVRRVVVQVGHQTERRIMLKLGASDVVVPSEDAGQTLAQKVLLEGVREALPMGNGYFMATLLVPAEFVGKTLVELRPRERFHLNVVALFSEEVSSDARRLVCRGEVSPKHEFHPNDFIGVFGKEEAVRRILEL